jgi:hypothetical protein
VKADRRGASVPTQELGPRQEGGNAPRAESLLLSHAVCVAGGALRNPNAVCVTVGEGGPARHTPYPAAMNPR